MKWKISIIITTVYNSGAGTMCLRIGGDKNDRLLTGLWVGVTWGSSTRTAEVLPSRMPVSLPPLQQRQKEGKRLCKKELCWSSSPAR